MEVGSAGFCRDAIAGLPQTMHESGRTGRVDSCLVATIFFLSFLVLFGWLILVLFFSFQNWSQFCFDFLAAGRATVVV